MRPANFNCEQRPINIGRRTRHIPVRRVSRERAILAALLLLASANGFAQQLPPATFVPTNPSAADVINVRFFKGPCVLIVELPSPGDIVRVGRQIDVIFRGTVVFDSLFCVYTPAQFTVPIGRLPEGSYMVRIVVRDNIVPGIVYPPIAAGGIDVTPAMVPTLATHNVAVLALATLLAGSWALGLQRARRTRALRLTQSPDQAHDGT